MSSPKQATPDLKPHWDKVCIVFPILNDTVAADCSDADYNDIEKLLIEANAEKKIRNLLVFKLEKYIRINVVPPFWKKFGMRDVDGFELFKTAVYDIFDVMSKLEPVIKRLASLHKACQDRKSFNGSRDIIKGFKKFLSGALLSKLPMDFHIIVNDFYRISFNCFDIEYEQDTNNPNIMNIDQCPACTYSNTECECNYIKEIFHEVNKKLMELQLLEKITGDVLANFIQERVMAQIQKLCHDSYETSLIDVLEKWLDDTVVSWMSRIYGGETEETNTMHNKTQFKQKLLYYTYNTYANIRIDQLYFIIIEYPKSQPAIEDLKFCLNQTNLRSTLCTKLQTALETKLLHPGVNTSHILTAYVSAIKALRHLDPSGVMLEKVTKPVRNYLRSREDTVKNVVRSLTEEGTGSELAEELIKNTVEVDKADEHAWKNWNPDPMDAEPNFNIQSKRDSDIISMLVSVYGSKELFVSEYRTLLADRLLAQSIINIEKEIKYLELLKLRFGETQLHYCEVMLKDVTDSKRINGLIQQDKNFDAPNAKFASNAMILSAQFWPPFKDESLELPDIVKKHLESYTKSFESLKGNRTLSWKPHIGNVDIEIEIGNKTLELTVSPLNATLIMHFENKPEWSLHDLQKMMKVPATLLRRKITYWQSMGIISEKNPDFFVLVEGSDTVKSNVATNQVQEMICEDDESESAMASAHDQREGEMQVFWSYIVGMLTNLDSLPLDRIHQMLKMFASQAPCTECSLQELRQFLDTKVRGHQLVFQGGLYKLPKG